MTKLTVRERKFVASKVKGSTNAKAYVEAGYSVKKRSTADVNASKLLKKAKIQDAINQALEHHGATPEFAVGRLKEIAEQNKEIGAARLASKDILELHGWQRGERPNITLQVDNASFFHNSRPIDNPAQ